MYIIRGHKELECYSEDEVSWHNDRVLPLFKEYNDNGSLTWYTNNGTVYHIAIQGIKI